MDGIRQHKVMAGLKEGAGDFGVDKFHSEKVNGSARSMMTDEADKMPHGMNSSMMRDGERAGPPHVQRGKGMMPATAHSDHGPHGHVPEGAGSFGVQPFKAMNG